LHYCREAYSTVFKADPALYQHYHAAAELIGDHPVDGRLAAVEGNDDGAKGQIMLPADAVAVMAVEQHLRPVQAVWAPLHATIAPPRSVT
jgi:hypothetical protein